jgi:hypothetical protein
MQQFEGVFSVTAETLLFASKPRAALTLNPLTFLFNEYRGAKAMGS